MAEWRQAIKYKPLIKIIMHETVPFRNLGHINLQKENIFSSLKTIFSKVCDEIIIYSPIEIMNSNLYV